ncbi:MAG TPA: hypothetical protein VMG33_09335 [Steroidobacteraceae bacterium]|nr:hypothetical protein [Steroidobacteraceae bacterium]
MAREYRLSFTVQQVEALIRALEECGIDAGSPRTEHEHFRDAALLSAAKSAYGMLKATRKSQRTMKP